MNKLLILAALLSVPAISFCRVNEQQQEIDALTTKMIEMVVVASQANLPIEAFESEIDALKKSRVVKKLRKQLAMAEEGRAGSYDDLAFLVENLEAKLDDPESLMHQFNVADEDSMDDLLFDGDFDVEDILEEIGFDVDDLYGPCGR